MKSFSKVFHRLKSLRYFALIAVTNLGLLFTGCGKKDTTRDEFIRLTTIGKASYDRGHVENTESNAAIAITQFEAALALAPNSEDGLLNLANAFRLANEPEREIEMANRVLELNPSSAAAHYLIGCGNMRLQNYEEALMAFQISESIEPNSGDAAELNALTFQLGRAHYELGQFEEAERHFANLVEWDSVHPSAWYYLGQTRIRLGKVDQATVALEQHQQVLASTGSTVSEAVLERCRHTEIRLAFDLEQPDARGVNVTFTDATERLFGAGASDYSGPFGILDVRRAFTHDLLVRDGENTFQILVFTNGAFEPFGQSFEGASGNNYSKILVGDVANPVADVADSLENAILLGGQQIDLLQFDTAGTVTTETSLRGLNEVPGADGILMDWNSDGFLDFTVLQPDGVTLKEFENLGPPFFEDKTATSGIPEVGSPITDMDFDDWNGDDLMDLILAHADSPPTLLLKQRGGPFVPTPAPEEWPTGRLIALGDMNNNLRVDMVVVTEMNIECLFSRLAESESIPLDGFRPDELKLIDYDNDGWLDIIATGNGIRVWRNTGQAGFTETTSLLGLDDIDGRVEHFIAADFDQDCDLDLVLSIAGQGLQFLENNGANANRMLKVKLIGTRSNRSGIGVRLKPTAGNWRTTRTVKEPWIEIGAGTTDQVTSLDIHWFDVSDSQSEISIADCRIIPITELSVPAGSCPYLYRWDGEKFTFVTDLLGAAPLGLPISQDRFIEADTHEFVWIGNENMFLPKEGYYTLQVTEELREVLYLEEAKLVVVDHPAGTEVYSTSKLVPGTPWPEHGIVTLHNEKTLLKAINHENTDVTDRLRAVDRLMVSPTQLAVPQMRGHAEPHHVVFDFGELDVSKPLVLVMNGWLQFGGGMANISSSLYPDMPFPFPVLEVEMADGNWEPVDVTVGAPAGKTKTIVVDLDGRLPVGSRRLRLGATFEIHWDRIALMEKYDSAEAQITALLPDKTDLHWRGFSEFQNLPDDQPLSPDYDQVFDKPHWVITPSGWHTRYGDVSELVESEDNTLVLMNGGDELTLEFAADGLPDKSEGHVRDFFFYNVGWDKDSDFHVAQGWTVGPLPWHGMDYQRYGEEPRPENLNDEWIKKFNTRWIGPKTVARE